MTFRVGCVNIDGALKSFANGELRKLVINCISALTETWLCKNECLKINGFKYIGKNRTKINKMGRYPGGIGFLINNVTEIKTKHEESLWIRVKK